MSRMYWACLIAFALLFTGCNKSNETLGDKAMLKGNKDESIKYYQQAIEEGNIDAIYKLAFAYENFKQLDEAKKYYMMASEKGNIKATTRLGAKAFSEHQYEEAVKYLQPLADSGNNEVLYDLGSSFFKLKEYDKALEYLLRDKDNRYIKNIIGQAYYEKGDLENAEKYWKSAVDNHASGGVNSHKNLLKLYKKQGRTEDYYKYKDYYQ